MQTVLKSFFLGGLLILSTAASAMDKIDPQEILKKADEYRNFRGKSFAFDLTLQSIEPGETAKTFQMRAEILNSHTSLIVYTGPASERGKALLMEGTNLWFQSPTNSKPIRITPQQRLLGEASNGDVASTDFSGDYVPAILSAQEVVEGVLSYKLELTAKPDSLAAYKKIHFWVNEKNFAPIKADFFAASGKMLKTAYYKSFEKITAAANKPQLVELEIVNAVSAEKRTTMRYSNFSVTEFPASRFTPAYLQRVR